MAEQFVFYIVLLLASAMKCYVIKETDTPVTPTENPATEGCVYCVVTGKEGVGSSYCMGVYPMTL